MLKNDSSIDFDRQLLEDKDIMFAGYKIPHPLQYQLLIKVPLLPNLRGLGILLLYPRLDQAVDVMSDLLGGSSSHVHKRSLPYDLRSMLETATFPSYHQIR